jgi:hypothetical protein
MGGFDVDRNGLLAAARIGYMLTLKTVAREVIYLQGNEAADHLERIS